MDLPNKYDAKEIESKWKQYWEKNNTYAYVKKEKNFTIDTPPPTVSGTMHMGHAFSYSQGDFIARFQRMIGNGVFYPFGTDDNGLPTEHLIEKMKKVRSISMDRSEFVELCDKTIEEIKPEFIQAWIDLGVSADYKNSYSTISKDSIKASQKSFLELHKKGHIRRATTPTTWCVKCQTAIAQADFDNIDKSSKFNDIKFKDEDGNDLIIATTRPELIPACVALFCHPDDERYKKIVGKKAIVPLFNYKVPIMTDETVAIDKGTGLMMVCTFGDKEDVEKWHKYKLDSRIVFTKYGTLNELAQKYEGLKILPGRQAIIDDLKTEGFLLEQKDITHAVNVHERCGTEIEFMVTPQWFIDVLSNKDMLVKAADKINWNPEFMKTRYVHWVENLNWDWCISRQRHFGVPFPIWYEKDSGKAILADESQLPTDPTKDFPLNYSGNKDNLIPEKDVMDTWATSSITPQIANDLANKSFEEVGKNIPMSIRLQAHDIIRTWAFYTITKSMYHHNKVPWENIMVAGFVLDPQGKKMSKSIGNTIDPLKVMEDFSADAIRYAASSVKLGDDIPFNDKYVLTGKKTATKIFNASKFVHMNLEGYDLNKEFDYNSLTTIDKWIISLISKAVVASKEYLEKYEFSKARAETDKVFWTFCDYYLEIAKDRVYKSDVYGTESKEKAQMTLSKSLNMLLKLYAPFMPFITEEVYSWEFAKIKNAKNSIHLNLWPVVEKTWINEDVEKEGNLACDIISAIRKYKNENQVSQNHEILKLKINSKNKIDSVIEDIKMAMKVNEAIICNEKLDVEVNENITISIDLAPKEEKK